MRLPVLALALALSIGGCSQAKEDPAFGEKVKAYLMAHPEVIKAAVDKYNANLDAQAAQAATAAIGKNRVALENDPRDFVANPAGKVTVTEFYDYRCPHCINVAPKVLAFVQAHPNVRFVFKEMPIFGELSEHAAMGAMAVKAAGGDYLGAHRDMMAARPLDEDAVARVLKAHGADVAALSRPDTVRAYAQHLADTHALAGRIGIEGTPAFIVGDVLIPGEDMPAVEAAVAERLKKG